MSFNNDTSVTASSSIIVTLDLVKIRFVRQLPLVFVIFAFIGFIGNAFTFLQPALRRNTFCIYSLCGSIIDIINLLVNLLPNYIYATDNILALITSSQSCKWKIFGLAFLPQLPMSFLILSLIDRYVCTCSLNAPIRRIHQLKMVPWLIAITVIVTGLIPLYAPILLYDAIPGFGCVPTRPLLAGVLYIILFGLIPPFTMLIFVWLTYRNVLKSRQRTGVAGNVNVHRPRHQFIRTVFTQVVVTSFFVLQWIIIYIYHITTQYDNKTAEQWAIDYFVLLLTNTLFYMVNVKSFYLSTLTSRLFRETFIKAFLKLVHKYLQPQGDANSIQMQVITRNAP